MSKPWHQYQEEAAEFFRSLGFDAKVDFTMQGVRSAHAIDVYVSFEKWGMSHSWIVECKKHSRPISKADVEVLKTIANEVGAGLAFPLSESGFQAGAFESARKTSVVLSSLAELREKSTDDVLRETLSAMEVRVLLLQETLIDDFTIRTSHGPGHFSSKVRAGIDRQMLRRLGGAVAMLDMALNDVRIGKLPTVLPTDIDSDSDNYLRCETLEEFVSQAQSILTYAEEWAERQSPE